MYGYTGTLLAQYECTVRDRVVRPERRMRQVCTGLRVHRYTMSRQSGVEWPGQGGGCDEGVWVHRYTTSKQSGRRMRRVCAGAAVHYQQTVRAPPVLCQQKQHGVSVYRSGTAVHYQQTVRPRVHRYTTSKQSGPDPWLANRRSITASMYGCTGTLPKTVRRMWRVCTGAPVHYEQTVRRMWRVCTGTPVHYEQTVRPHLFIVTAGARSHRDVAARVGIESKCLKATDHISVSSAGTRRAFNSGLDRVNLCTVSPGSPSSEARLCSRAARGSGAS